VPGLSEESGEVGLLVELGSPFPEEIKAAVWGLVADKSPGPDKFPIHFYRHFWDIVKPVYLTELCTYTKLTMLTWYSYRRRGML